MFQGDKSLLHFWNRKSTKNCLWKVIPLFTCLASEKSPFTSSWKYCQGSTKTCLWKVHNCGKDFIIRSREIFQDYFRFVPQEWFPLLQASLEQALHSSFWSPSGLLLLNWICQLIAVFHRCDNLNYIEPKSRATVGRDGKSFIKGGTSDWAYHHASSLEPGACR